MEDRTVIEWDKDDLDALGILKVDVLALGMLTCLRRGFDLLRMHYGMTCSRPRRSASRRMRKPSTHALARRYDRRVPDRKPGADVDAAAAQAAEILRSRDRGRDRAARSDPGRHGASLSAPPAAAWRRSSYPVARPITATGRTEGGARQDARRAAVPGTGDAHRHRGGRIHAGRSRPAAPRHGDVQAGSAPSTVFRDKLVEGMASRGYPRDFAERCFQPDRRLRRIRLSGKPCGELRAARLCLGLDQMPLSRTCSRRRCSTASRWAFTPPPRSCATRRSMASKSGRSTSMHSDWDCTLEAGDDRRRVRTRLHPRHADDARRYPRHACDAARLSPDQRLCRSRRPSDRAAARRRLRFGARPVAAHRTSTAALERLAAADAFRSLGLDRREALWAVRALRRSGDKDDLPLFARVQHAGARARRGAAADAARASRWSRTIATCICRSRRIRCRSCARELDRRGILRHEQLADDAVGPARDRGAAWCWCASGRAAPTGVIFMTLEDETAHRQYHRVAKGVRGLSARS